MVILARGSSYWDSLFTWRGPITLIMWIAVLFGAGMIAYAWWKGRKW